MCTATSLPISLQVHGFIGGSLGELCWKLLDKTKEMQEGPRGGIGCDHEEWISAKVKGDVVLARSLVMHSSGVFGKSHPPVLPVRLTDESSCVTHARIRCNRGILGLSLKLQDVANTKDSSATNERRIKIVWATNGGARCVLEQSLSILVRYVRLTLLRSRYLCRFPCSNGLLTASATFDPIRRSH